MSRRGFCGTAGVLLLLAAGPVQAISIPSAVEEQGGQVPGAGRDVTPTLRFVGPPVEEWKGNCFYVSIGYRSTQKLRGAWVKYTADDGPMNERRWCTKPATVEYYRVSARLPKKQGLTYYFVICNGKDKAYTEPRLLFAP